MSDALETSAGTDEIFRPCLIGGKSGRYPTPPRFHEIPNDYIPGSFASVDMVRLRLHFGGGGGTTLDERAATLPCDDGGYSSYTARVKPGGWKFLHTYKFGETSVALGIGQVGGNCAVNMHSGFLEFNPNKLAGNADFQRWFRKVSAYVARAELWRYDLAVDLPIARSLVRLEKDKRRYELVQGKGLTEYLGQRNAPGRVKVYDKALESGLVGDDGKPLALTRVELTCDGDWSVGEVLDKWPTVYTAPGASGLRGVTGALVRVLAEKVARGESVEPDLAELDHKTRKKVRAALEVRFDRTLGENVAALAMLEAGRWADAIAGAPEVVVPVPVTGAGDEGSGDGSGARGKEVRDMSGDAYCYEYGALELRGGETPSDAAYRAMQWALETSRMLESEYGREMTVEWLAPCGQEMACWSWVAWVNHVADALAAGKPVRVSLSADCDCLACSAWAEWR